MTDADSPLDQTLMDRVRTNDQDHEDRINSLVSVSSQEIRDDFISGTTAVDSVLWDTGGGTVPDIVTEHQMRCLRTGSNSYSAVSATDERIHIDTSEVYVAVIEFRIKNPGGDADDIAVGFQDVAHVVASGTNVIDDTTDFIGVVRGGASDWTIRVASGGTPTDRTGQGSQASWTKFKFSITCGASPSVSIDVDDVSSGAAITTNIPTTILRPVAGISRVGTDMDLRVDYILAYFEGRPLAA